MDTAELKRREREFFDRNAAHTSLKEAAAAAVSDLRALFPHYSWVGIYWLEGDVLRLGPWSGREATEHVEITLGKGICGSAAASGRMENVPDVGNDSRYLSCFLSTRSEIVVPIFSRGRVIGEIDIDSDAAAAFGEEDERFLSLVADWLGALA